MGIKPAYYEELLATCCHYRGALDLLKQHRPYLERLPSMRRPRESIVTLPLPNIRLRRSAPSPPSGIYMPTEGEVSMLPCDLVVLMCDPDWKIKTGIEVYIFIHRPQEDFSGLLYRWRQTQQLLAQEYEWLLPQHYDYLLSDRAESTALPLFVVFPQTPKRIRQGLMGAGLPVVTQSLPDLDSPDPSPEDENPHPSIQTSIDLRDLGLGDLDNFDSRDII